MNKKQRKNREKQSRAHTQDTAHCAALREHEGAKITQTEKSDCPGGSDKNDGHKSTWTKFVEWCNFHSPAVMAIFTAALVFIGFSQARMNSRQLDVVTDDERAWIKFETGGEYIPEADPSVKHYKFDVVADQALVVPLRFINTGKSPALDVRGMVEVEVLNKGVSRNCQRGKRNCSNPQPHLNQPDQGQKFCSLELCLPMA